MFGISLYELLIVLFVIFIFIRPSDIGNIIYSFKVLVFRIRLFVGEIIKEIEQTALLDDLKKLNVVEKPDDKNSR